MKRIIVLFLLIYCMISNVVIAQHKCAITINGGLLTSAYGCVYFNADSIPFVYRNLEIGFLASNDIIQKMAQRDTVYVKLAYRTSKNLKENEYIFPISGAIALASGSPLLYTITDYRHNCFFLHCQHGMRMYDYASIHRKRLTKLLYRNREKCIIF